ncbi:MAG: hypothetical protein ABI759_28025 [Candidatus Solibacter sp.]
MKRELRLPDLVLLQVLLIVGCRGLAGGADSGRGAARWFAAKVGGGVLLINGVGIGVYRWGLHPKGNSDV